VSLVPAVTEMLFAIGSGPQVVGVSQYDRFPPEVSTRTRVGALLDPDLERILGLRPDLVVSYASQEDLHRQLSRAGIPIFSYRHAELRDVLTTLRAVGVRVGRMDAAEELARQLEDRMDRVRARTSTAKRPRVLLVFGREAGSLRNIYASGGFGFLHDMLTIAGGNNVLSDVRRESVQATSELILARRPDVIVELQPGAVAATSWRVDSAWFALSSVPAIQNRRVIVLQGDHFMIAGSRVAEAVEALAAALHPPAR
ncbi:MAG: ABC transporter substrate-binding protein, partial [Vicinamibacterales bacterium]